MTPITKAMPIVKSDSTDLGVLGVRGVWVGGAGDLAVRLVRDPTTTITFVGVLAGTMFDMRVTRVMNATTATNLVGILP